MQPFSCGELSGISDKSTMLGAKSSIAVATTTQELPRELVELQVRLEAHRAQTMIKKWSLSDAFKGADIQS